MRRALAVVVAAAWLAATPAFADKPDGGGPPDQARLAAAKAVIDSAGGRAETLRYMNQTKAALVTQMRNQDPAAAERAQKQLDEFLTDANPKVVAFLDEMQGLAINFYASNFSTEELNTIAAFQASSAGTKFRAVVPELMASMAAPMFRFQHELMAVVQK